MSKYVMFDTEFKDSMNKNLTVVCAAMQTETETNTYWLTEIDRFKKDFERYVEEQYTFYTFMSSAEYRFLLSIGYTREYLKKVRMIDIYPMWRILLYGPSKFSFGKYVYSEFGKTKILVTQAPKKGDRIDGEWYTDEEGNEYKYEDIKTRRYNPSLVHACARLLNITIDAGHKDKMRDIILYEDDLEIYKEDIMKYCLSDVKYLKPLANKCFKLISEYNKYFKIEYVLKMSEWMLDVAVIESNGIPIDREKVINFSNNYETLAKEIPEACNAVIKFYNYNEKLKKYTRKYDLFKDFVEKSGVNWPKTEKGKYKQDKKTLKDFESSSEIRLYSATINALKEVSCFQPKRVSRILNNISEDGYLRCSLMPYASQTSRCQPRPTDGYIFLMSRWIRNVIDDKKVIIGGDYSAQEIYVGAELSKDKNFLECYNAGDAYVWFAKKTGNIPGNITRKSGVFYEDGVVVSDSLQIKYTSIRYIFKGIMLGVGYGMGEDVLALYLTGFAIEALPEEDRKRVLSGERPDILNRIKIVGKENKERFPARQRADYYKQLHLSIFSTYHKWRKTTFKQYERNRYLRLEDGWCLIGSEGNATSVCNFPVQGGGQVYLRKAVAHCLDAGLKVITTLHDAIYIESTEETKEADMKLLHYCMTRENPAIRCDVHEQTIDWTNFTSEWSDEKGAAEFKKFGKYFLKNNNE